ncbi:hypothetical protein F5Y09DRAFT_356925 [Xylaria sp. FL1042]|nr:hypothetical protein F5Y09DRAFT_356925 [Xylaria sp. FL1042]
MITLQLALKAVITWLMIQMLYTADSGTFVFGMLMCGMFGNGNGVLQPSLDLFLFIWTGMVSKRIETFPEPHEAKFDAHILTLAGLYFVAGDKLRYTLLGAWLPYFYGVEDYAKCSAYLSLVVAVPMLPHLRRAYQVVWPPVSTMLCNGIKMGFSRLCIYAMKAMKAMKLIIPCSLPFSHPLPPPPPPPTFSISTVITTANIVPEKPRAIMVDASTQTEPPPETDHKSQYEESWLAQPVCGFNPKTKWTYIAKGNVLFRVPLKDEPSPIEEHKPSRIRRTPAPKVPTPAPSPPHSPSHAPPTQAVVPANAFTPDSLVECAPIPNTDSCIEAQHDPLPSAISSSQSPVPSSASHPIMSAPTLESEYLPSEIVDETPITEPFSIVTPIVEMAPESIDETPIPEPVSIVIPVAQTEMASKPANEVPIVQPISTISNIPLVDQVEMVPEIVNEIPTAEPSSILAPVDQLERVSESIDMALIVEPVPTAIPIDQTEMAHESIYEPPIEEPILTTIPIDQTELPSENVDDIPMAEPTSIITPADQMEMVPESIDEVPIVEPVSTITPLDEMDTELEGVDIVPTGDELGDIQMGEPSQEQADAALNIDALFGGNEQELIEMYLNGPDLEGLDFNFDPNPEWALTEGQYNYFFGDMDFTLPNMGEDLQNPPHAEADDIPLADVDDIPFIEDYPLAHGFSIPPIGEQMHEDITPDTGLTDNHPNDSMVLDAELAPATIIPEIDPSELSSLPPTPRETSPAAPSPPAINDPTSPVPDVPASPARPMLAAVPISNRLPPPPPRPSPAEPPIVFNMAASPAAPKLDSRFVISGAPRQLSCSIRALQPGYRAARELSSAPRTKAVYIDDYEGNDGYRQKALWRARGSPPLDGEALAQLEQRMNQAAEEAKRDWPSRQEGIKEQTALDLAAKKERDKKKMEAIYEAQRAAEAARPPRKKKEKAVSCFITPKRRGRP